MPFHPSPAPRLRMMLPYAAGFFSLAKVKGLGGRRHGWSVELEEFTTDFLSGNGAYHCYHYHP